MTRPCLRLAAKHRVASSRQAVSQHIDVLVDAGLVETRREGRYRFHHPDPRPLVEVALGAGVAGAVVGVGVLGLLDRVAAGTGTGVRMLDGVEGWGIKVGAGVGVLVGVGIGVLDLCAGRTRR